MSALSFYVQSCPMASLVLMIVELFCCNSIQVRMIGHVLPPTHSHRPHLTISKMTKDSKTLSTIRRRKGKEVAVALQKLREENPKAQVPVMASG